MVKEDENRLELNILSKNNESKNFYLIFSCTVENAFSALGI